MIRRLLLVFLPASFLAVPASGACPGEGLYSNQVVIVEGDLRYVFGTDSPGYLLGAEVSMYLGVENTGDTDLSIPNPGLITPPNEWLVLPGGCTTLTEECETSYLFRSPEGTFFFGNPTTVPAGGCVEKFAVWDGLVDGVPPVPGTYQVWGGYFSGSTGSFHAPAGGARVSILLEEEVAVDGTTWSAIKRLTGD